MDKLVIIGNLPQQCYLYEKATSLNCEVISVCKKGEEPSNKQYSYCETVNNLLDVDSIIKCLSKYDQISAVCSMSYEKLVLPAAQLCEYYGLPGIPVESATLGTNKRRMIEQFQKNGVIFPKSFIINEITQDVHRFIESVGFPLILKPTDNSAKRGVFKINSMAELEKNLPSAVSQSTENLAIIQEFITGKEIFASTFIDGDKYYVSIIDKLLNENFVEIYFTAPSKESTETRSKINSNALNVMKALKLNKGYAHTEMIVRDGVPYVIETSPRVSYATVSVSKYYYSLDEVVNILNLSLNKNLDFSHKEADKKISLIHLTPESGKILDKSQAGRINLNNMKELVFLKENGAIVKPYMNNTDRIAYAVFENPIDTDYGKEMSDRITLESILFR